MLKTLIYKFNFEFNPKCPLLTLLFQYTHKYNFLHQKLIDIVHQDIDQQLVGVGNGGSMAVSNSFVIYKLHWESKQLRLNRMDAKHLKDHNRYQALKKKYLQVVPTARGVNEPKSIKDLEERWNYFHQFPTMVKFTWHDPYITNDLLDNDWVYSRERLDLLRYL